MSDEISNAPEVEDVAGSSDLVYLDYNCFQRGFDDPTQVRIQMEALACQEIFMRAFRNQVTLAWSFMHEDETILCPFPTRQQEAFRLAMLCVGCELRPLRRFGSSQGHSRHKQDLQPRMRFIWRAQFTQEQLAL